MKSVRLLTTVCLLTASTAGAQGWSVAGGSGPFVFGDFVRRTLLTGNEGASGSQTTRLSAATRAGLAVDVERGLGDRFAVRLEAAFTHAPIAIKGRNGNGVSLQAGTMNGTSLIAPLVLRLNPRGTFRFHLLGGPAYGIYNISRRSNAGSTLSPFTGTRSRAGAAAGGGVAWQWSRHLALEAQIMGITTASPFRRSDFPGGRSRVEIPRTRNGHTTAGLRYRF